MPPSPTHGGWQVPFRHVFGDPQGELHVPQCDAFELRSTHSPLQRTCAPGQAFGFGGMPESGAAGGGSSLESPHAHANASTAPSMLRMKTARPLPLEPARSATKRA